MEFGPEAVPSHYVLADEGGRDEDRPHNGGSCRCNPVRHRHGFFCDADLDESRRWRAFSVHVGDTVLLTLPDDIRPGDGWVLDHYDSKVLEKQTSETRNIPPLNRVDAPVDLMLSVKTKAPGTSELVLKYLKRGKEVGSPFRVRINVQR